MDCVVALELVSARFAVTASATSVRGTNVDEPAEGTAIRFYPITRKKKNKTSAATDTLARPLEPGPLGLERSIALLS